MKTYRIEGHRGHWTLSWTDNGKRKTTHYQYKGDVIRAEKLFKEAGYTKEQ